jgi:oxygen-independent coproporphyrinogen III oxidase
LTRIKDTAASAQDRAGMDRRNMSHASRNVPRYTSYPTAPHFTDALDDGICSGWLEGLDPESRLSLYLHVPYCRSICHYCGCHTKATKRDEPVRSYARSLRRELDVVLRRLERARSLVHVHWGGGTPSILHEDDFLGLVDAINDGFSWSDSAEHAIELDPRMVTPRLVATLKRAGINRVNLGVQDFNPAVQTAIGRWQPYEQVVRVVDMLRDAGLTRIGFDLMYGLPHQGEREIVLSAARAAGMWPDRIAVFGYAHVPWLKKHQRRIDATALPGAVARFEQAELVARVLQNAGYSRIGLDHYAMPDDDLAVALRAGSLRRNFQGYTSDPADVLLGIGASAIGRLPQGYVQNAPDLGGWRRAVENGRLPVARGKRLDADDRLRADVIEQLMCFFACDLETVCARHGVTSDALGDWRARLELLRRDGLVEISGTFLRVPLRQRSFVRIVAAVFDAYLEETAGRHSAAV